MNRLLHYSITCELGQNIKGISYQALDTGLECAVVIRKLTHPLAESDVDSKLLDPMKRLSQTASAAFARFFSLENVENQQYIIREYVDGASIAELRSQRPFPYQRALSLILDAARILKAAHDLDLYHQNISGSNLFVEKDGNLRLVDPLLTPLMFGLSFDNLPPEKLCYIPPEQLGAKHSLQSVDCYALGVLLYEMLTGESAASGRDGVALSEAIRSGSLFEQEQLARIPEESQLLVKKMISLDPADRFSSMEGLTITVQEMILFQLRNPSSQHVPKKRIRITPRQYLLFSILIALIMIFWLVISADHR